LKLHEKINDKLGKYSEFEDVKVAKKDLFDLLERRRIKKCQENKDEWERQLSLYTENVRKDLDGIASKISDGWNQVKDPVENMITSAESELDSKRMSAFSVEGLEKHSLPAWFSTIKMWKDEINHAVIQVNDLKKRLSKVHYERIKGYAKKIKDLTTIEIEESMPRVILPLDESELNKIFDTLKLKLHEKINDKLGKYSEFEDVKVAKKDLFDLLERRRIEKCQENKDEWENLVSESIKRAKRLFRRHYTDTCQVLPWNEWLLNLSCSKIESAFFAFSSFKGKAREILREEIVKKLNDKQRSGTSDRPNSVIPTTILNDIITKRMGPWELEEDTLGSKLTIWSVYIASTVAVLGVSLGFALSFNRLTSEFSVPVIVLFLLLPPAFLYV
jgi:hypothetical protein